jgi:hypothetical protein
MKPSRSRPMPRLGHQELQVHRTCAQQFPLKPSYHRQKIRKDSTPRSCLRHSTFNLTSRSIPTSACHPHGRCCLILLATTRPTLPTGSWACCQRVPQVVKLNSASYRTLLASQKLTAATFLNLFASQTFPVVSSTSCPKLSKTTVIPTLYVKAPTRSRRCLSCLPKA